MYYQEMKLLTILEMLIKINIKLKLLKEFHKENKFHSINKEILQIYVEEHMYLQLDI